MKLTCEALVGMATEKAPIKGKAFQFYMSTALEPRIFTPFGSFRLLSERCGEVVHMVNVTMRASLDEQFEADEVLFRALSRLCSRP